jgi:hypothetical protein
VLTFDENPARLVLSRYCLILQNLTNIWPEEQWFRSPLPDRFEAMISFARAILEHELTNADDSELHEQACEAIIGIVRAASPDESLQPLLGLFTLTLNDLTESKAEVHDDFRSARQAGLCGILTTIVAKLRARLPQEEHNQCIAVIFDLLRIGDTHLFEEAMLTLGSLHVEHHQFFSLECVRELLSVIREGFGSTSPAVIRSSAILLADFFHFQGPELVEYLLDFLNMAEALLLQNPDTRGDDFHRFVIKAITEMLESVAMIGEMADVLSSFKGRFLLLLRNERSITIDPTSTTDLQYASSLFEFVCGGYRVFALRYYPPVMTGDAGALLEERNVLVELSVFAGAVAALPWPSDFLLLAFCKMMQQYVERCSRRHVTILGRSAFSRVLQMCDHVRRPERLKRFGRETSAAMRNR